MDNSCFVPNEMPECGQLANKLVFHSVEKMSSISPFVLRFIFVRLSAIVPLSLCDDRTKYGHTETKLISGTELDKWRHAHAHTHNANVAFSCRLTWKLNIKELETTETVKNEAKQNKKGKQE